MERILLDKNYQIKGDSLEPQYFIVDKDVSLIEIPNSTTADILFGVLSKDKKITINVGDYCNLTISFLAKENIDGVDIIINEKGNSHVEAFLADFSTGKENFKFIGNLLDRESTLNWHLASLSASGDNKNFDISVNHNSPETYAKMDNYGVCKDDGKLVFAGISQIYNGSKGSKTHQNSKIMVFNALSNGIAKPILKIDENDIEASHAAVVGKINDEHLFYLTSRGLSEAAAKELITYGYLKPIMNGFIEEQIKEEIASLIERRM